jgi:hypothetical protein
MLPQDGDGANRPAPAAPTIAALAVENVSRSFGAVRAPGSLRCPIGPNVERYRLRLAELGR